MVYLPGLCIVLLRVMITLWFISHFLPIYIICGCFILQSNAYSYLSFMQALKDSGMTCHDELHTLICALVLPECDDNFNRVPPCKSLCTSKSLVYTFAEVVKCP